MKHERAVAFTAFAIVCVVWGTTYLFIRIAVETIPPLLLTGIRYTVAGLVMLAAGRLRGESIPRDWRVLANLAFIGLLMVGVGNLSVVWAEQWVPSGMAALFVATAPFWAAIIELLRRNGEKIQLRAGIGMAVGFLGVAMLVMPSGSAGRFDSKIVIGGLAIQLGSLGWQYGTARGKYTVKDVPLVTSAAIQMLAGGIIVDLAGLTIGEASRFHVTPRTLGALAYLTVFGSVVAYSAYVFALHHIKTTKMSLYAYVNPVVAVILGWLVLNERLTWLSVLAMVVILAGVALVQTAGLTRRKPVAVPEAVVERDAA
ncbi:MAG TPA: EamA family transporter [Thermoanaerobaculia bacterium]|nr:EamA family transporter [Thermoanaerobaculia bacterium]